MMKNRPFVTSWILLAVLAAACSSDSPTSTTPPPPGANVAVGDNFFNPNNFAATVGNAVTWQWTGGNSHNVTFDNGDPGSSTQTSGSFSRTFTATGTFDYHCTVHGAAVMSGTVTVSP